MTEAAAIACNRPDVHPTTAFASRVAAPVPLPLYFPVIPAMFKYSAAALTLAALQTSSSATFPTQLMPQSKQVFWMRSGSDYLHANVCMHRVPGI